MKKMVNGEAVDMTAEEIAARAAEEQAWADGAAARAAVADEAAVAALLGDPEIARRVIEDIAKRDATVAARLAARRGG